MPRPSLLIAVPLLTLCSLIGACRSGGDRGAPAERAVTVTAALLDPEVGLAVSQV